MGYTGVGILVVAHYKNKYKNLNSLMESKPKAFKLKSKLKSRNYIVYYIPVNNCNFATFSIYKKRK